MAVTQAQLANQMLAQLRVLDPSVSGEVGTPERKIIDTVAEALSDAQVDLSVLQGALNLDSKVGTNLDNFLALFGFGRQQPTRATGFARFSRSGTPASVDIRIPTGSQILSSDSIPFTTTSDGVLRAGDTFIDVSIICTVTGTIGNKAADTIQQFAAPIFGVTDVTNVLPLTGGVDAEDDDEYKVRFKNTVFRNLAGTQDQFLALAVATQFTTKANVVGPISRYREYVQIPSLDDTAAYDVNEDGTNESGDPGAPVPANAGEYTIALSTIPYSKHVYSEVPFFVTNGQTGVDTVFYRADVDFRLNIDPIDKNRGDARRFFNVSSPLTHPPLDVDPLSDDAAHRPNLTFTSVYGADVLPEEELLRPGQVVLFEHSYMSTASRNDFDHNVTNAVDVFIDGGNNVTADTVTPAPGSISGSIFVDDPASKFHYENYRRFGEANHPPVHGNLFIPLYWQPVTALPEQITVAGDVDDTPTSATYYLDEHYWLVEDVSDLHGTIRARNGIEWGRLPGQAEGDQADAPFTGPIITEFDQNTPIQIVGYSYDKNVLDLQAALDGAKQVTTDVLAHATRRRYYRLNLTVMYSSGASTTATNSAISDAVSSFFAGQYFGTAIQLSDLLQVVHSVSGVDNVRWSSDVPASPDLVRVEEVTVNGDPLLNVIVDRVTLGTASAAEVQRVFITGQPTSGLFRLSVDNGVTWSDPLAYNATATDVQTALNVILPLSPVAVVGLGTADVPFIVTWLSVGEQSVIVAAASFAGGPTQIRADFFLRDDELPSLPTQAGDGDTLPGLVIQPRAQNTWTSGRA